MTKAKVPTVKEVKRMSRSRLKQVAAELFPDLFPDGAWTDRKVTPWTLWRALTDDGWYLSLDYVTAAGNDGPEIFAQRKGKDIPYPLGSPDDPTTNVLRVAVLCRRYDLRGDKG